MNALNFTDDRFHYAPEFDAHADDRADDGETYEPTSWDDAGAPWGNQTIAVWGDR